MALASAEAQPASLPAEEFADARLAAESMAVAPVHCGLVPVDSVAPRADDYSGAGVQDAQAPQPDDSFPDVCSVAPVLADSVVPRAQLPADSVVPRAQLPADSQEPRLAVRAVPHSLAGVLCSEPRALPAAQLLRRDALPLPDATAASHFSLTAVPDALPELAAV